MSQCPPGKVYAYQRTSLLGSDTLLGSLGNQCKPAFCRCYRLGLALVPLVGPKLSGGEVPLPEGEAPLEQAPTHAATTIAAACIMRLAELFPMFDRYVPNPLMKCPCGLWGRRRLLL